jgi:hypothetical protein
MGQSDPLPKFAKWGSGQSTFELSWAADLPFRIGLGEGLALLWRWMDC